MKTVTVVGTGFAGLTVAHELSKQGFQVALYEKQERAGGLLSTEKTPYGLVESAANALLADRNVEALFAELGLEFAARLPERKRRYVFWDKPRRWPLSLGTTVKVLAHAAQLSLGSEKFLPTTDESIAEWAERFAGSSEFLQRLLSPGLQGVYAGDDDELSAVLVLRSLLGGGRAPKGQLRGSIAPVGGMGQLISAMVERLQAAGAQFEYDRAFAMPEYVTTPLVLATSPWSAAEILAASHPRLAERLRRAQSLPLVSVTCFFEESSRDPRGFGCLFPRAQKFNALGVLFNTCIFEGRAAAGTRSETWIFGGAHAPDMAATADDDLLRLILSDRERLGSDYTKPLHYKVNRWPRAIPHYTRAWARELAQIADAPPLYLHGNYLGALGLSRLYGRSIELARRIKENHG